MKKVSNRVIMLVIAMAMLFAMTTVAFAATKSESFLVIFGSSKYTAKYTATLNVTSKAASASLSISDYIGTINGANDVVIHGTVYNGAGEHIGYLDTLAGGTSGTASCTYSQNGNGYSGVHGDCTYTFVGKELCTLTETAE